MFAFRPECCSGSKRNGVRLHTGIAFAFVRIPHVLTIGVSTLLQAWLGHRMAMVHGPNVIPSLAIIAAFAAGGETYALQSFTAQALSGIVIVALVALGAVRYIRKVWSPLILGSMIIMIGLTVAQVGLGDMTQAGFGVGFFIALALALGGSVLAIRGRGFGRLCRRSSSLCWAISSSWP